MTSGTEPVDQVDLHLKMLFILSFGHQVLQNKTRVSSIEAVLPVSSHVAYNHQCVKTL